MSFLLGRAVIFFISITFFSVLYIFVQNIATRVDFFVLFFAFEGVPLLLIVFLSGLFGFFLQIILSVFLGLRKGRSKGEIASDSNKN